LKSFSEIYARMPQAAMAAPGVHAAVLDELQRRCPEIAGKRILDAPCGRGPLSELLAGLGARVDAVDLCAPPHVPMGVTFLAADLERIEPEQNAYDVVLSVEGIEHLHNPSAWIEKIARALKDGGHLILSTPNPDDLSSRFKAFTRGYHAFFEPVPGRDDAFRGAGHIHPIYFSFVEWMCRRNGLEILGVRTKAPPLPAWLARPLHRLFYSHFPETIMPLIKGSVAIYTIFKPTR
jgi:SAM-dependent methyltransferase